MTAEEKHLLGLSKKQLVRALLEERQQARLIARTHAQVIKRLASNHAKMLLKKPQKRVARTNEAS